MEGDTYLSDTGKKATMDDIANRLGISKNSVSLALNDKKGVSDTLRQRVLDVARELNYGGYSAQKSNKSSCIITIVPEYLHNDSFFYFEVFWAIDNEIKRRKHISISTGVSRHMEKELILPEFPTEMRILGLLVIGVLSEEYIERLKKTGYPMLTVDITYRSSGVSCVGSANLGGGYLATKHLIGCGHKNIGFIGPIHFASSVYERFCGFRQAMMNSRLEINPNVCITGNPDAPGMLDTPDQLEPSFNALKEYPTAWFCAGDRIAFALLNILSARNISVPNNISIIGFDDIPLAEMTLPRLSTIHIDRKLMGRLAVEQLLDRQSGLEPLIIQIQGALVIRDSVARLP